MCWLVTYWLGSILLNAKILESLLKTLQEGSLALVFYLTVCPACSCAYMCKILAHLRNLLCRRVWHVTSSMWNTLELLWHCKTAHSLDCLSCFRLWLLDGLISFVLLLCIVLTVVAVHGAWLLLLSGCSSDILCMLPYSSQLSYFCLKYHTKEKHQPAYLLFNSYFLGPLGFVVHLIQKKNFR